MCKYSELKIVYINVCMCMIMYMNIPRNEFEVLTSDGGVNQMICVCRYESVIKCVGCEYVSVCLRVEVFMTVCV